MNENTLLSCMLNKIASNLNLENASLPNKWCRNRTAILLASEKEMTAPHRHLHPSNPKLKRRFENLNLPHCGKAVLPFCRIVEDVNLDFCLPHAGSSSSWIRNERAVCNNDEDHLRFRYGRSCGRSMWQKLQASCRNHHTDYMLWPRPRCMFRVIICSDNKNLIGCLLQCAQAKLTSNHDANILQHCIRIIYRNQYINWCLHYQSNYSWFTSLWAHMHTIRIVVEVGSGGSCRSILLLIVEQI